MNRSSLCRTLLPCLLVSFASRACLAHEDTRLGLDAAGAIVGLPADYAPAKLAVVFSDVEGARKITSLSLQVRGGRVELPLCVLGLVNTEDPREIQLSGSWYHDESIVPSYVQVKLFDPGHDPSAWASSGFTLLFNLHTAKLMEMEVDVVREKAHQIQSIPVDLRARCTEDEVKGFWQGEP